MKYLFALVVAISLTLVWQTQSLENGEASLKSVGQEEVVTIPPQAT
ncbi:MAG: hypothetical protein ABFS39_07055 [Pseudomonadota bacterium]